MDSLKRSILSKWIRGAQTTLHEFVMFWQAIRAGLLLAFVVIVGVIGWFAAAELDNHERYIYYKSLQASVLVTIGVAPSHPMVYVDRDGQAYDVEARTLYTHPQVHAVRSKALKGAYRGLAISVPLFIIAVMAMFRVFYRSGIRQTNDAHVRGAVLTEDLKSVQGGLVRQEKLGPLTLGKLRLPAKYEVTHQLINGGPGTGKTQIILQQLTNLREAGRRVIVYDNSGDFVAKFARPGHDVILNPFDERSPTWKIWDEVRYPTDYETMAEAVIPEVGTNEPFWPQAAQIIFRGILRQIAQTIEEPTNADLVHWATKMNLEELETALRGTEAAVIIDKQAEKMAVSARATLATHLKGFAALSDEGESFSIKDFIDDDSHDRWLFISCENDKLSTCRSLISLWMDIAVHHILSLTPDKDRRVHFYLDELPTLQMLPSLQNALAQSRKYGGAFTLGLQSIEQLNETYGEKAAEAITGNCSTWTLLRANDAATSKWASDAVGKSERAETNEGVSIAGNEIGDRRTTQRQVVARETILPAELRGLPDLEGFIILGRGHPILRTKFTARDYDDISPSFILKSLEKDFSAGPKGTFSHSPGSSDGALPSGLRFEGRSGPISPTAGSIGSRQDQHDPGLGHPEQGREEAPHIDEFIDAKRRNKVDALTNKEGITDRAAAANSRPRGRPRGSSKKNKNAANSSQGREIRAELNTVPNDEQGAAGLSIPTRSRGRPKRKPVEESPPARELEDKISEHQSQQAADPDEAPA